METDNLLTKNGHFYCIVESVDQPLCINSENDNLSQPSATLFGRTNLGKTSFQIKIPDLIQLIKEDRLRHTCGPIQQPHPLHRIMTE